MTNTETHRSTYYLNRLIILLTVFFLVFVSVFSWQSWQDEKAAKLQELENLLELEEKAIDSYFTQIESDLMELGQELTDMMDDHIPVSSGFYDSAFVMLKRFTKMHAGLLNVFMVREDGQILLSGKDMNSPDLPSVASQPSWVRYCEERRQDNRLNVGRVSKSLLSRGWNIPLRYEVRNREENTVFILSVNLPVDMLQNFCKNAPFTRNSLLGLIREDGFLVSRYPLPVNLDLSEIYGKPRTGVPMLYLRQEQFPDRGHIEGLSSVDGINYLHTFRRMEHFPLTLFINVSVSDIRAGWGKKVRFPFLMMAFLLIGGFSAYRATISRLRISEAKRKQAEEALRVSEERYRTLANFTYDWESWIGPDHHFIYCSPSCERITGYRAEEFENNPELLKDITHPDDHGLFIHHVEHLDDSNFTFHEQEIRIFTRSGDMRWIAHACCAVYSQDGTFLGRRACNRDITDRKQIEEKVYELNRDFVSFLEHTSDIVFFKNEYGYFRFCSQVLADNTGHASWRDMIGKHTLEVFPKDIGQIYNDEDAWVVREGRPLLNMLDPYYDASGEKGWIRASKWPLMNTEGRIVGLFGISRVVTELKRLEDELLHINETLEKRVAQEVQKNMEQERMLIHQSRMAAMGEMLGNIAHQWKQPLNGLNILFFNIRDAYNHHELDEAYIDQVVADGKRLALKMSATITDFRNFFRPDKEITAFSVTDQIRQAIVLMQPDFDKNEISVHVDARQDLMLSGFPNEYSHVLLNLLSNARDAILRFHPSLSRVDVVVTAQDGQGCVRVRDTGGGIPEDILSRIFDPYFTTKQDGSGIGLYMSKMIIEDHMNGSISAKNIDGGTEFRVNVPLSGY